MYSRVRNRVRALAMMISVGVVGNGKAHGIGMYFTRVGQWLWLREVGLSGKAFRTNLTANEALCSFHVVQKTGNKMNDVLY
jgi:hypothetical protein